MPLIRFRDRVPAPWPNGLGTATEIARDASVLGWRLSIATIDGPAWFSSLPDVERALLLLGPSDLTLEIDGDAHELRRFDVVRFRGEQSVRAIGVERPLRVLNLMVDRALGDPELLVTTPARHAGAADLIAATLLDDDARDDDDAHDEDDARYETGDTLLAPVAAELAALPGASRLAAARIIASASRASRPPK